MCAGMLQRERLICLCNLHPMGGVGVCVCVCVMSCLCVLCVQDVFAPTPSREEVGSCSGAAAPQEACGAKATPPRASSPPGDKPAPPPAAAAAEPPSFTLALQLTVNTESVGDREAEDDSQATQIEEPLCVDESDSMCCSQSKERGAASSQCKAASPVVPNGSQKQSPDLAATEASRPSLKSEGPATAAVGNVNAAEGSHGTKAGNGSCLRPTVSSGDLAAHPLNATPCTVPSQSVFPQAAKSVTDGSLPGSGNASEPRAAITINTPSLSMEQGGTQSQKDRETLCGGGGDEEERREELMEEEEVTVGPVGSGMGLALSQSQLLSPEPMEEEGQEEEREEGEGEDKQDEDVSDGLLKLSERSSQVSQQAKTAHSQPACSKVSTNGHQLHSQSTDSVQVTPDRLSLKGRAGPEADGPKDKSFSDSSGGKPLKTRLHLSICGSIFRH